MLIITKGQNYVKMYAELQFLFSAHFMIMLYLCTMFRENSLNGLRMTKLTRLPFL